MLKLDAHPVEIAALIGYRLEFWPTHSVVVASVRENGSIGLVARLDDRDATPQTMQMVARHVHEDNADSVIVAVFNCELPDLTALPPLAMSPITVTSSHVGFLGREQFPIDQVKSTRTASEYTFKGTALASSRDDLLPCPSDLQKISEEDLDSAADSGEADLHWERALTGIPASDAHLLAGLQTPTTRDAVMMAAVTGERLPLARDEMDEVMEAVYSGEATPTAQTKSYMYRIIALAYAAPTPIVADEAWAAVAWLAWMVGNGAQANGAIEKMSASNRLSTLVESAMRKGIAPPWVRQ